MTDEKTKDVPEGATSDSAPSATGGSNGKPKPKKRDIKTYDQELIDKGLKLLKSLGAAPKRVAKKAKQIDVIRAWEPFILEAQGRGWTTEMLCESFRGIGFEISNGAMRSALNRIKKAREEATGNATSEASAASSAAIKDAVSSANSDKGKTPPPAAGRSDKKPAPVPQATPGSLGSAKQFAANGDAKAADGATKSEANATKAETKATTVVIDSGMGGLNARQISTVNDNPEDN